MELILVYHVLETCYASTYLLTVHGYFLNLYLVSLYTSPSHHLSNAKEPK